MNEELFEFIFPINTIYFSFEDKQSPLGLGKWERLGFNVVLNCFMFKRIG